jgi:ABC-type multidrug transport system fused ATPase/permease subunit
MDVFGKLWICGPRDVGEITLRMSTYPTRSGQVLSSARFAIKSGETVAFVGPSGMASPHCLPSWNVSDIFGSILLNSIDVRVERDGLTINLGLWVQEPVLFTGTI